MRSLPLPPNRSTDTLGISVHVFLMWTPSPHTVDIAVRVEGPRPDGYQERVQKLRQEIADISAANRAYIIKNSKDSVAAAEQERRLQRLKEIMDELRALTDWKET
jgi:hypothetical protein